MSQYDDDTMTRDRHREAEFVAAEPPRHAERYDDRADYRPTRGHGRDVTSWARGVPGDRAPRGFLDRRRWVETKWAPKTTEFLTLIVAAIGLLVTALTNDGFDAYGAWKWGTVLAVGYMISRGLAKLGKGTYDDD